MLISHSLQDTDLYRDVEEVLYLKYQKRQQKIESRFSALIKLARQRKANTYEKAVVTYIKGLRRITIRYGRRKQQAAAGRIKRQAQRTIESSINHAKHKMQTSIIRAVEKIIKQETEARIDEFIEKVTQDTQAAIAKAVEEAQQEQQDEQIKRLLHSGKLTMYEIANVLNLSLSHVRKVKKVLAKLESHIDYEKDEEPDEVLDNVKI